MLERDALDEEIEALEEKIASLTEIEEKRVIAMKALAATDPNLMTLTAMDHFRKNMVANSITKNRAIHDYNSLVLKREFLNHEDQLFDRIIIGAGISATMVFAELPRESHEEMISNSGLPHILILNDPTSPHTWPKEKSRLMGQPQEVQSPQILSARPRDFVPEKNSTTNNPYDYVNANYLNDAIIETQNDLNMSVLNLKAIVIESVEMDHQTKWSQENARYRIRIGVDQSTYKYAYTNHIDLCTGQGETSKLTSKQIDPVLAEKLCANDKLIYAQDGEKDLSGDVIFYGGSAINAALTAEISIAGMHPNAHVMYWVARDPRSFEEAKQLNRIIAACFNSNKIPMVIGEIEKILELPNGKLSVTFSSRVLNPHYKNLDTTVVCDQLVVAIGQVPQAILKNLTDFEPIYLKDRSSRIPIGTRSKDGCIVAWGAAGGGTRGGVGLNRDEVAEAISLLTRHARTLPHESWALGGIYRSSFTNKKLAEYLRDKNLFPKPKHPQSSAHYPDLADINLATCNELMDVIRMAKMDLTESMIEEYANKIIQIRSELKHPEFNATTGIHDMKQLKNHLPEPVWLAIRRHYFPFNFDEEKTDQKKIVLHGTIKSHLKKKSPAHTFLKGEQDKKFMKSEEEENERPQNQKGKQLKY